MKTITISLSDPKYQHEAEIAKKYYGAGYGDCVEVPVNTKFGKTKPISSLSAKEAKEIAEMLGLSTFCYPPLYTNAIGRITLHEKPGIIDPMHCLPSIIIWHDADISYYRMPDRLLTGSFIYFMEDVQRYLVKRGYLITISKYY